MLHILIELLSHVRRHRFLCGNIVNIFSIHIVLSLLPPAILTAAQLDELLFVYTLKRIYQLG